MIKAKPGDTIRITLTDNTAKIVELVEIKTFGIEAKDLNFKNTPLTFFPFHNILYVKKQET